MSSASAQIDERAIVYKYFKQHGKTLKFKPLI